MIHTDRAQAHVDDESRWAALMCRAQAGSESDYRTLLTELSIVIDRYLRSRIGHHHFIEDCVQEALIAIHGARHTYDPRRPFRPWLFAIVRHKAIDALRQLRNQRTVIDRHRQATVPESEGTSPDDADGGAAVGWLMQLLPADHREAIRLTRIEGLSTADAAARLCISESALKVRVHRAIRRLARLLEDDRT